MNNRNASASAFGWDFQVNAAILLMLENIREANAIRVEGKDEDIELSLRDHTKIYSQAKAINNPLDTSNVLKKLSDALNTLHLASHNADAIIFTYITNSMNPFNDNNSIGLFSHITHLSFDELPEKCQKKINNIIKKHQYSQLDTSKLDIRVLPFYGKDFKNRYKHILERVNSFINELKIYDNGIGEDILKIWQNDLFHNATITDTSINVDKKEFIWSLVVVVLEHTRKYKCIINFQSNLFEFVTKVISDYTKSRLSPKSYVEQKWLHYTNLIENIDAENDIRESLIKIILYKIINKHNKINLIKKELKL